MAHQPQFPTVPKLYKVIEGDKSCNGGNYTWKTNGQLNELPLHHRGKALRHCSVGFHLTTDWRHWYGFGRDVYTATPCDGQILVQGSAGGTFDDKVVVASCTLSQKNADPLAKLLKHFYDDVIVQCKKLGNEDSLLVSGPAPKGAVLHSSVGNVGVTTLQGPGCFVNAGFRWQSGIEYDVRNPLRSTINFILAYLVKSVDDKITEAERNTVHELWNLWKAGWIVVGKINRWGDVNNGKYVVQRGRTGEMPAKKSKKLSSKTTSRQDTSWPFPRGNK